jgi:hypothetical protein
MKFDLVPGQRAAHSFSSRSNSPRGVECEIGKKKPSHMRTHRVR